MDKSLFSIKNMEIFKLTDEKSGWPFILFTNLSEHFGTSLKWDVVNFNDPSFWGDNAEKINTLLHNRTKFEDKIYKNKEEVLAFIENNFPKYTPQEKLDNVHEYLHGLTSFDGQSINFDVQEHLIDNEIWRKYYFANKDEFIFYLENLEAQNLIKYDAVDDAYLNLTLTLNGITKLMKINEIKNSRYCFVAMSFAKELEPVYDKAILPALKATGFEPIIIRKEHVASDKTINDAIIASIKKSRFTIADFTQHRAGVYFEAGYALGRGQKVIYTCRNDEIEKAHFDTRNFQHIVWETIDDFKDALISKIEAYIID